MVSRIKAGGEILRASKGLIENAVIKRTVYAPSESKAVVTWMNDVGMEAVYETTITVTTRCINTLPPPERTK